MSAELGTADGRRVTLGSGAPVRNRDRWFFTVHPAFLWGGLFLILSMPLRIAIGHTGVWLSSASWLTQ